MSDQILCVSATSRGQALADGLLVDVAAIAAEAGFKVPVAVTRAVWVDCIAWNDEDAQRKAGSCQDQEGRLWDVVYMAFVGAREAGDLTSFTYQLRRVPVEGKGLRPRLVKLMCQIHGGDAGEPVLTISMPGDD